MQGFFGQPGGASPLASSLTRFTAVVAGLVGVAFSVVGIVTGDQDTVLRSVGPFVLAAIALSMIISQRERVLPLMTAAVAVVVLQVRVVGVPAAETPAAIGLVVVGMAAAIFIRRNLPVFFASYALIIVGAQIFWQWPDVADGLARSVGSLVAFAFSSWIVLALRNSLRSGADRYELLFSKAPVSLWEEDFSALVPWLLALRSRGVTDLEAHLRTNPHLLDQAAALIKVRDVNDAAVRLLGARSRAELLGHLNNSTMTESAAESLIPQLLAIWHGADYAVTEVHAGQTLLGRRLDGLLHWSAPRVNGRLDLEHVIVAVVDLTAIRDSQARLEELVRSKEELVASVSHEIRTPLTAVVGFADQLTEAGDSVTESERHELLSMISDQGHEIETIVDDLLAASRAEIGGLNVAKEIVALRDEVKAVTEPMEVAIPCEGGDDIVALADPSRVRQIIRNLVNNALKYGGEEVRVTLRKYSSTAILEVRDSGPPLPAHEREAIFQRYYRARQTPGVAGSVGLGLNVSRTLARNMNGDLHYEHDGSESVFRLTLPAAG